MSDSSLATRRRIFEAHMKRHAAQYELKAQEELRFIEEQGFEQSDPAMQRYVARIHGWLGPDSQVTYSVWNNRFYHHGGQSYTPHQMAKILHGDVFFKRTTSIRRIKAAVIFYVAALRRNAATVATNPETV